MGVPNFVAKLDRSVGNPGAQHLHTASVVGAAWWD